MWKNRYKIFKKELLISEDKNFGVSRNIFSTYEVYLEAGGQHFLEFCVK